MFALAGSLSLLNPRRAAFALLIAGSCAISAAEPRHEMVPMRDGARLSTYLYVPAGSGPWPVLYEQRYADLTGRAAQERYAALAAAGYVVAAQNFRGTHRSEGVYQGYRALGWGKTQDGYDTVEWLAKQPWSTGKIGTFGGSQAGYAQNFLAVTRPPHLVAQYITDGGLSLFHLGYRRGGATRLERFKQAMLPSARDEAEGRSHLADQVAHPDYDDYWAAENCFPHFAKMNVPAFIVASWFDFMARGSIDSYIGRQHQGGPGARGHQWMRIGPWLHGGRKTSAKVAELDFPDNAAWDMDAHMVEWFDFHLKGKKNSVDRAPRVRYYITGAVGEPGAPGNVWRDAPDWPVPAQVAPYYLHPGGGLAETIVRTGKTEFLSDPMHPAPVKGRNEPTARDAREFESHPDVRSFTTEALTAPQQWTGDVRAEIFLSSTAPDTDLFVRVTDVYPDGRSIVLVDSVQRAKYRSSFERASLMRPGQVYKLAWNVGWMSHIFAAGHRIRVTVSGNEADYFEPNPNTGEIPTYERPVRYLVARNALHPGSRVIAPRVK
ncbi:MAG: CocE/NonD family hydrolase [Bryobacteraceae bacterium]